MPRNSFETSQALPQRPSMAHLRKEAKSMLRAHCEAAGNGTWRLADAQRAVARRYGFSGWRSLKRYVDAVVDVGASLVDAVRHGDIGLIDRVLTAHPMLVDAAVDIAERIRPSDERAMRLLHLAVAEDQASAAAILIAHGANLDVRNSGGRAPLHDCFELGRDQIKDQLLAAGAQIDICVAAAYGMLDHLDRILATDKTAANDLATGLTPLAWAAYGGKADAVRRLISAGATLVGRPFDSCMWGAAAHVAATGVVEVVIEAGADPDCQDASGDSPIHLAIKSPLVRDPSNFVATLLDRGASASITNAEGRTALDEAIAQRDSVARNHATGSPIGAKNLVKTIARLKAALGSDSSASPDHL